MRTTLAAREQLVGQVLIDVGALMRDLRAAVADRFAVHGMSMSRIADFLDVSMPNASGLVDRMVERGLVERVGDPEDRRVVLVRLTSAGLAALEAAEGIKLDRIRTVCERLDDGQLTKISDAIGDLRDAIAQEFPAPGKGRI